ncbi:hypothetical protein RHMOL_Rhmol02G0092100 [Rhododendron molle]|uniref:Uncharacterized protein n=1 Tax=Rhododendron molle TaxID=49168 RepID=A0ACC0PPL2_RHOML|nr:hypothetical protein RHMOL_Rhmol02G0092100 [Rhododendron molle]
MLLLLYFRLLSQLFVLGLGKLDLLESQATIRSYPIEAIGPLASTKVGLYLVGGAPSGDAYVWESYHRNCQLFLAHKVFYSFKVWDLVTGKQLQNLAFPLPITASVLDPAENMLFSGSVDGRTFKSTLDVGLVEDSSIVSEDEPFVL